MMIYEPIKRERDTQRQRVYHADKMLHPFNSVDVSTVPLMEAYVATVWRNTWLAKAYPKAFSGWWIGPPIVKDGRGRSRRAGGCDIAVYMPRWARHESILIHELAHCVTQRVYGYNVAAHGWQYCEVYLTLALHMMGRDAHDALKLGMRLYRVRYTKPRAKRPLSDEQRVALTARLAAYRAAATDRRS